MKRFHFPVFLALSVLITVLSIGKYTLQSPDSFAASSHNTKTGQLSANNSSGHQSQASTLQSVKIDSYVFEAEEELETSENKSTVRYATESTLQNIAPQCIFVILSHLLSHINTLSTPIRRSFGVLYQVFRI